MNPAYREVDFSPAASLFSAQDCEVKILVNGIFRSCYISDQILFILLKRSHLRNVLNGETLCKHIRALTLTTVISYVSLTEGWFQPIM